MAQGVTLENIKALNVEELSEALKNNGFPECAGFVLRQNIDGEKFFNNIHWYKGGALMPREVRKIKDFILAIRIDPQKFVLPRTVYREEKQNKAEDEMKIEFIQIQDQPQDNSNRSDEQAEAGEGGAYAQLAVDAETTCRRNENAPKIGEYFENKPCIKQVPQKLQRFMSQTSVKEQEEQDGYDFLITPAVVTPENASPEIYNEDNSLTGNKYYKQVDRFTGQKMLKSTPEGTFLLRSCTNSKYHCALMVNTEESVRNVPIVCKGRKFYLEDGRGSKNQDEVFYDLYSLIAYYTVHEIELAEKNVLLAKDNVLLRK